MTDIPPRFGAEPVVSIERAEEILTAILKELEARGVPIFESLSFFAWLQEMSLMYGMANLTAIISKEVRNMTTIKPETEKSVYERCMNMISVVEMMQRKVIQHAKEKLNAGCEKAGLSTDVTNKPPKTVN